MPNTCHGQTTSSFSARVVRALIRLVTPGPDESGFLCDFTSRSREARLLMVPGGPLRGRDTPKGLFGLPVSRS